RSELRGTRRGEEVRAPRELPPRASRAWTISRVAGTRLEPRANDPRAATDAPSRRKEIPRLQMRGQIGPLPASARHTRPLAFRATPHCRRTLSRTRRAADAQ